MAYRPMGSVRLAAKLRLSERIPKAFAVALRAYKGEVGKFDVTSFPLPCQEEV